MPSIPSTTGALKVKDRNLRRIWANRSCVGALIVYDITDQDSFARVNTWIKELRKYLPLDTPIIIAGNKCDMSNRQIPLEEAEK
jgi:GTPase SAR1 family protein